MQWDIARSPTSVQLLVQLGADHGVPADACLLGTSLSALGLQQPEAVVTARDERVVIENLLASVDNPEELGLEAGSRYHLTTYGIWGFALVSSPTLRAAVDVGLRYLDLTFAFSRIRVRDADDEFHLVLDTPDVPAHLHRFAVQRDAAAIRVIQRELFAAPLPILHAQFDFPPTASIDQYREIFSVAPQFESEENVLALPAELLDAPLPQANAHTAAITREQCRDLLQQRHARAGLSGQVRDLLLADPAAPPSAEQVARQLAMSARTLRHRLAAEGASFRGLLDEVRRRLAEEMLVTGRLTVSETAARLGYVELSSFSQAFRRWNGMGPSAFRTERASA